MSGIFYGVGVGPGDPQLMTLQAVRILTECDVIAVPVSGNLAEPVCDPGGEKRQHGGYLEKCAAYQIILGAGIRTEKKSILYLPMPMMKEKETLRRIHDDCAGYTEKFLDGGRSVALITLGDPSVYSTCMYVYKRIRAAGYETMLVPGVPSFCAAAARMDVSLAENSEELHIIPASYGIEEGLKLPGTKVLMKAGKKIPYVRQTVKEQGLKLCMAENCGMEQERIYRSADEIPDQASYYSLFIVKEKI